MTEDTLHTAKIMLQKRLPEEQGAELLHSLLSDAALTLLSLTHREQLPAGMAGLLSRLSAVYYNRLGLEGENLRREGSVHMAMDGVPDDILREIRAWRLAWVPKCVP